MWPWGTSLTCIAATSTVSAMVVESRHAEGKCPPLGLEVAYETSCLKFPWVKFSLKFLCFWVTASRWWGFAQNINTSGKEQRAPAACQVSINPAWSLWVSQTAWDTLSTPVRTYAKESSDLLFVSVGRQSGIELWTEFTSSASTTQQHTVHDTCEVYYDQWTSHINYN